MQVKIDCLIDKDTSQIVYLFIELRQFPILVNRWHCCIMCALRCTRLLLFVFYRTPCFQLLALWGRHFDSVLVYGLQGGAASIDTQYTMRSQPRSWPSLCPTCPSYCTQQQQHQHNAVSLGAERCNIKWAGLHLWFSDPDCDSSRPKRKCSCRLSDSAASSTLPIFGIVIIQLYRVMNWAISVEMHCQEFHPLQHILWKLKCILLCYSFEVF